MKNIKVLAPVLACLVICFSLFGCGNVTGGGGGGGGSSVAGTGVIWGRILNTSGVSLDGVTVSGGGKTGSTNQDGVFSLSGVAAGSNILVDFSKTNYISTQKSVQLATTGSTYITGNMTSWASQQAVTAASGGTVASSDGASLTINSNSLPSDGTAYIKYFNPTVTNELGAFPGAFLGRVGGVDTPIETFGFIAVEVLNGGAKIDLLPGATAEVKIPIAAAQASTAPATIELWSYNDTTGSWDLEGIATKEGSSPYWYRAVITHFSWWNADRRFDCAYVKGNVVNDIGEAVEGAIVYASGVAYEGILEVITNQWGSFEGLPVKYNELANVHAQKGTNSSNIITDSSIAESKPGDDIGTLVITGESIATITLTWGEHPHDLDSHFTGPTAEGQAARFHVYYGNKNPTGAKAWLDTDDVTSYGPEITTISRWREGMYRYCVHNYSGQSGGSIEASSAIITFVSTDGTRIYNVPTSNPSNYNTWKVFEVTVDSTGHITNISDINSFVSAESSTDMNVFAVPKSAFVIDAKEKTAK